MRLVDAGGRTVAGGTGSVFGRLDVWLNFGWVTLNDRDGAFARVDAEIACREMGHWGGRRLARAETPAGGEASGFWPFRAECAGEEPRLEKCGQEMELGEGEGEATVWTHDEDVGVACFLGHDNP